MNTFNKYLLVSLIVLIVILLIAYTTDYIELPRIKFNSKSRSRSRSSSDSQSSSQTLSESLEEIASEYMKEYKYNSKPNFKSRQENFSNYLKEENQETKSHNLIESIEPIDSDNFNKQLFIQTEEYQMTEGTGNAIANALANV